MEECSVVVQYLLVSLGCNRIEQPPYQNDTAQRGEVENDVLETVGDEEVKDEEFSDTDGWYGQMSYVIQPLLQQSEFKLLERVDSF